MDHAEDAQFDPEPIIDIVQKYVHRGVLEGHQYKCGHCGTVVRGAVCATALPEFNTLWLLCLACGKGSVKNDDVMLPPPQSLPTIEGLPDDINGLYDEARASFDAYAYTGCEMLCRKILMNAAVDKGAKENKTFQYYVDYLRRNEYVIPPLKEMAAKIREYGNKSTHEIDSSSPDRAELTLRFTWRILDTIYGAEHEITQLNSSYEVSKTRDTETTAGDTWNQPFEF